MTGILIIASGHPFYTHMAYNLAVTIKANSEIPITLARNGCGINFLLDDQKKIFDSIIFIPDEFIKENGEDHHVKAKTFIYDLSPYQNTLYLDADMIASPQKKVSDLIDSLKGISIQFACRGESDMTVESEWCDLKEVQEKFGINHWYELSSEVIYFEKSDNVKRIFDDAKHYYSNHGFEVAGWTLNESKALEREKKKYAVQSFAGAIPDEFVFSLSLEKNGQKIICPYEPSYWQGRYFMKFKPDNEIINDYYFLSAGGAHIAPNTKRIYDQQVKYCFQKLKIRHEPYRLVSKSSILKERKII